MSISSFLTKDFHSIEEKMASFQRWCMSQPATGHKYGYVVPSNSGITASSRMQWKDTPEETETAIKRIKEQYSIGEVIPTYDGKLACPTIEIPGLPGVIIYRTNLPGTEDYFCMALVGWKLAQPVQWTWTDPSEGN